jgi:hypothetical protein
VDAEHPGVQNRAKRELRKARKNGLVNLVGEMGQALIAKAIESRDIPEFVIPTNQEDLIGIQKLQCKEKKDYTA